jgi:hypothetical protein
MLTFLASPEHICSGEAFFDAYGTAGLRVQASKYQAVHTVGRQRRKKIPFPQLDLYK